MLLFSFSANSQSINQALTATATQSGGGVTIYGPQNYNDGIITATPAQTPWGWVSTNGWIEYTWTSPVSINAVALYKADRPMTICTFQYWDGNSYVNFFSYNNTVIAYDSISFPTITTTRLRFDGVAGSGNPWRCIAFMTPSSYKCEYWPKCVKRVQLSSHTLNRAQV